MRAPRTRDRGQTTQDYAIGIGLFLLIVIFALTFVPSVLAPFEDVDANERAAQAERAANTIVERAALDDERVHLEDEAFAAELASLGPTNLGLPSTATINVTVTDLDDETVERRAGRPYDGQDAGSWTRIVTTDEGSCVEGCRMLVRVW
ncbi:MAG: hypothetical protein ACLFMX_01420 [Halobacteriales archaeon]